ncbi:DUF3800 domain-containing protein [Photorhabdus luminescens]|uniref:DUF3800 domain-containing protein n=1 Tax=Photorhabdus luminescens subsp. mexicana TaxID=2100167 RepID=A0A4R4JFN8_PHOLU|nr:DUF3800 domain-containing protein [Photorhabdus luminescens]TDB52616.1 hypothetical protein C5468_09890 [Photorhabdus luminescens subsp. mexicana]
MKENNFTNIYFDESGNTGHNLTDSEQPVFVLASCNFDDEQSNELINIIQSNSTTEVHFKRLRKSTNGQDSIINLMSNHLINPNNVKISIFNKPFMVVSKIVDILIESQWHAEGRDLYKNGLNISYSNVFFIIFLNFFEKEHVDEMYMSFIKMIQKKTEEDISNFYSNIQGLYDKCSNVKLRDIISEIIRTRHIVRDVLYTVDKTALDPAIPALFSHSVLWGKVYQDGFNIIHDDSKAIESKKETFRLLMDKTQSEIELGYDKRRFALPLKAKELIFAKSEDHKQLQIADIISSSFAYWLNRIHYNKDKDSLFNKLNELNLQHLCEGGIAIWPSTDITPQELGLEFEGGLNLVNHVADFLNKARN